MPRCGAGRRDAASSVAPISTSIWALPASLPRGTQHPPRDGRSVRRKFAVVRSHAPVRSRGAPTRCLPQATGSGEATETTRCELGAEHGRGSRTPLAVAHALGVEVGRRAPAIGLELVGLSLLEEEAGARIQPRPAPLVLLPEPAMVA